MQKYLNHQNALKRIFILIMQIFNYVVFLGRLNPWTFKTKTRIFSDLENFCFNHLNKEKLPNPDLGNISIYVVMFYFVLFCHRDGWNAEITIWTYEGRYFSANFSFGSPYA